MPPSAETLQQRWQSLGIGRRLVFMLAIPLVLIVLAGALLDYRLARSTADAAFDHALTDTIYDLETHLRNQTEPAFALNEEAEAILRSSAPDKVFFSIRDDKGTLLAGDPGLPEPGKHRSNAIKFDDDIFQGQSVRLATLWLDLPKSGRVSIMVVETTQRRQNSTRKIQSAMLMQNLGAILVTLIAVFIGIRLGLRPLRELEHEVATRSAEDLRKIELAVPAELRPLIHRLNQLFDLLRDAAQRQQRFIADAAHQLRTPLTGLQTQLDLAVGEGLFREHPLRHEMIEEATQRLNHLLTQLLTYARAEHPGTGSNEAESVSLEDIVEKAATEFLDAALAKNIDLGFDIHPAVVRGHGWLLQEALANLIDNAIRYTPQHGVITVSCGESSDGVYLQVEDNGPGIPAEYQAMASKRFFRVPGSPGNGCGLGLSIVEEIARTHNARLEFITANQPGLIVRIKFPTGQGAPLCQDFFSKA